MTTNYELYFGTPKRAARTLYMLNFSNAELFEKSEERLKKDFLGDCIYKHNSDHAMEWADWLNEEVQ